MVEVTLKDLDVSCSRLGIRRLLLALGSFYSSFVADSSGGLLEIVIL
jgi:hypothetical protein